MQGRPPHLIVSVDLGTTSIVVCWQWSDSEERHVLKFPCNENAKTNEELEAVLGCSQDNWYYGEDSRWRSNVVLFENPKLAALGQQPYKNLLEEALRGAAQQFGFAVAVTLGDLYEKVFSYICKTLREEFLKPPESNRCCRDRSFGEIPKHCWVTYPVQYNAWLRMILADAAKNVGFCEIDGVPEPLAAAYFARFAAEPALSGSKTILIIDSGGGSTVWRADAHQWLQGLTNCGHRTARRYLLTLKDESSWHVPLMVKAPAHIPHQAALLTAV